ncbi:MAG: pseudouridine synthase [Burkholderiales bacterium]|nr:pseudouridine synthase [Burkholderiales bacterium]MDE2432066.1 pseudouridine synthase [Burkholderiales bacterium]
MSALPILFQDEHLVAIHKPAGWLVHRTGLDAGETRFVVQTLRDQLGQPVYPVHRLDKGTSGVLIMALSSAVARALALQFEHHLVTKTYLAWVRGWPEDHFEVDHPLLREDAPPEQAAQEAFTTFECLARLELPIPVDRYPSTRVALLHARPTTGRRHQIRRHLKHVSHPIIGDSTHGKGAHNRWWAHRLGVNRLWLHALRLSITHPVTQVQTAWESSLTHPANADWRHLLTEDWTIREDGLALLQTAR